MFKYLYYTILASILISPAAAHDVKQLHAPLDLPKPLALSGNFGELRNNHFHSGLDFKTNSTVGHKIYCAADGYVSRIVVSPWGFGRAIYVTHPQLGITTVYGHLQNFAAKIDRPAKARQYEQQAFDLDMTFMPGEIEVAEGEVIALSGNAGSSGGPHLHMDVRDNATGHALDPMPYFKGIIADNVAPQMRQLALYPLPGGAVNGTTRPAYIAPGDKNGRIFTAWGKVVPGIKAYDRMTGTTNIYGVKHLVLNVDGKEVYRHNIDRVDLNRSRAINSMVNYPDKQRRGSWVMTSRIADNDQLDYMHSAQSRGILDINEERDYRCEWVMTDEHGNRSTAPFTIRGSRATVRNATPAGTLFRHDKPSHVSGYGLDARFPNEIFYDDFYFSTTYRNDSAYCSRIYTVGDENVPLAGTYTLTIDLTSDHMADKSKYCMVRVNGKSKSALASTYADGRITAKPNRFGQYAIAVDTVAPTVTPVGKKGWSKNGFVSYRLTDNLSGIARYQGTIDGEFVLFELDGKTARATYKLEPDRVKRGQNHTVIMTAVDACGNTTVSTDTFYW